MPVAAVGAVATIGGALISSSASKKAANTASNATRQASSDLINETRAARTMVIDRMVPALKDYGNEIDNLQQYVANGTVDVMKTLADTTTNAMQIVQQSGANARKAFLGSAAISQGISPQQFEQQYSQIQGMPPAQQDQILSQAFPQAMQSFQSIAGPGGGTFSADQMRGDTGDRSTGAYSKTAGAEGVPMSEAQWQATQANRNTRPPMPLDVQYDREKRIMWEQNNPQQPQESYQSYLAKVASANANRPVEQGYEYSGYQDRGTPGINADVRNLGTGIVGNQEAAPGTGFYGAMSQLNQGENRGLSALASGTGQARTDIQGATAGALGRLDPYSQAGRSALDQEAALSGALGPEAQQQAINAFIESPGQQYLRERQESSLLRNASAIGGLGGGRVRTALMEQAMGIASTQQQSHLENLRSLAGRGQEADTMGAGIIQRGGDQLAQLATAFGTNAANLIQMSATQKAQLAESAGISLAQLEQAIGAAQAGQLGALGGQLAQTQSGGLADIANLGQQGAATQLSGQNNLSTLIANLGVQGASQAANLNTIAGSQLAAGQNQAGQTMAQAFQGLGQQGVYQLANLSAQPTSVAPTMNNPAMMPQSGQWSSNQPLPQTYTGTGMAR